MSKFKIKPQSACKRFKRIKLTFKQTKKNMYSSVLLEKWKMFLITLISSFIQPFNSFILYFQFLPIYSWVIHFWNLFQKSFWWERVTSIMFHSEFFFVSYQSLDDILIHFFWIEFVDESVSGAVKNFYILLPDTKCRK